MPKLHRDYTNTQINNRFIISFSHFTKANDPMWNVRCVCGNEFKSLTQNLKNSKCRKCDGIEHRKRPYESLYNTFINKAEKREYFVNITYEQFLSLTEIKNCHYCGVEIDWLIYQTKIKGKLYKGQAYNLDRINNDLGYTLDNVVVCCSRCNKSKLNHFTYDEWKQLGNVIKTWRKNAAN